MTGVIEFNEAMSLTLMCLSLIQLRLRINLALITFLTSACFSYYLCDSLTGTFISGSEANKRTQRS